MSFQTGASVCVGVNDLSLVGEARRTAGGMLPDGEWSEEIKGAVAIAVTELASNLVRHAGEGEMLLRRGTSDSNEEYFEVVALDNGPGMTDVARCLQDGFSTGGTAGQGLGAVRRLATDFDLYSLPGRGTVVVARFRAAGERSADPSPGTGSAPRFQVGVVNVAVRGERECGDSWAVRRDPERLTVMVADGLGHGPGAAEASREAVRVFRESKGVAPQELLQRIHGALRATRGAAVAVAELTLPTLGIAYAGVGNIAGSIVTAERSASMMSHNGTLGHEMRRLQTLNYTLPAQATVILHSDGLTTRWNLASYPGLAQRDPAVVAGILYRDHRRERDDVTVVVIR